VVLDGYHFGDEFQRVLRAAELRVLAIDDFGHTEHRHADLVLNQNLHATEALYPGCGVNTRLLLGTRFILLRREFRKWRGWKREIPDVARKVLVTLGGSDPDNVTAVVLEALQSSGLPGLEVVVVVGAENPRFEELTAVARGVTGTRIVHNVEDMPALLAWAELAVICAGGTLWELLYFGAAVTSAWRNTTQATVIRQLGEMGLVVPLAAVEHLTPALIAEALVRLALDRSARARCAAAGRELIDGCGTERVVAVLKGSGEHAR
jgi:spore coat polysaccharide biosynthesis predicted glycosyltransferase SpsG